MSVPKLRFQADDGSEFPEWEEKCLRDVSSYISEATDIDDISVNKYVSTENMVQDFGGIKTLGSVPRKASLRKFQKGDILMANIRPYLRKIWLADEDGACNTDVLVIRPNDDIDSTFLYEFLARDNFISYVMTGAKGSKMPRGDKSLIMNYTIPEIFIDEQRKIADFFSSLDQIILQTQSEIDAWEKQKRGVMQLLFSQKVRFHADDGSEFPAWEEKHLNEICDIVGGGTPSTKKNEYWSGDILWISSSDLKENDIRNINKTRYITQEAIKNSATKRIPAGSVLIVSRVGVGKVVIADEELCTSQDFANMVNISANSHFIAYCLSRKMQIKAESVQGTAIKGIPSKEIQKYRLGLPCLEEQQKIAACLSTFDAVIDKAKQELSAYRELKKGLLQQMFV